MIERLISLFFTIVSKFAYLFIEIAKKLGLTPVFRFFLYKSTSLLICVLVSIKLYIISYFLLIPEMS